MSAESSPDATLVVIAQPAPGAEAKLTEWEGRCGDHLFTIPGFTGLETQNPQLPHRKEWVGLLRFDSPASLNTWLESPAHEEWLESAQGLVLGRLIELPGGTVRPLSAPSHVTEVIVTYVAEGKEADYREWAGRIRQAFSKAPGFQGVTSQRQENGTAWTTLMRFDTAENLDRWLHSTERARFLEEARHLIERVHLHRVESSFPGWVGVDAAGQPPPRWKTAMLVLLSLYPVAHLDAFLVAPLLPRLPWGLTYFLPYVLGVILISYVMMPFFVRAFDSWLYGKNPRGAAVILALYAVEIVAMYWLFHGGFR